MEIPLSGGGGGSSFLETPSSFPNPPRKFTFLQLPTKRRPKFGGKRPIFRASSSGNSNSFNRFSWERLNRSLHLGSEKFWSGLGDSVKKETGFDFDEANKRVSQFGNSVQKMVNKDKEDFKRFRTELVPEFVNWNRLELWKDYKNWEAKRVAAIILYIFVAIFSCQRLYVAIRSPLLEREKKELTEAYMEALIPDPSPSNVRKFKKSLWRKTMPKGLKMKKFIEGNDGTLLRDSAYVGEDAWSDDSESSGNSVKQIIDNDPRLNTDEKKELKKDLNISDDTLGSRTWRERLKVWKEILRKERLSEQLDSLNAKYAVEFDMKEVENSLRKDIAQKKIEYKGANALWISKRWWRYRPKLPYTYLLQKLESSEVAAVVFTEDLKRLYVTMKEGFPLEYVVDIPLDPYLFETISSSGVEVDMLQRKRIHYFMKVIIALVPGLLFLWLIRESVMLLHITSQRFIYRKYNQLFDMAYAENLIVHVGDGGDAKSMYKEVILGGDVWNILDELMIYMRNPLQYYEKEVPIVRGILLHGPPGTGKTLFARTLAKQSGLPFIYATGAEFADLGKNGAQKIREMFHLAQRNAPSFVFIDDIDAIAGKRAKKDRHLRRTLEALTAQLDGEKERTGVDRFSLKQTVIFICATNRIDELDHEFMRYGRIDRRLSVGLPNAKQRVQIFHVHSAKKQLAEDVNFEELVFRTLGYSGADIRNLVNEAAIMSVRKGHSKVCQQDIIDVLDKQLMEGMGVLLTEEEQRKVQETVPFETKRLLAIHEAGHIVLAHLFPRFDWHAFSQLLPGGKETAISIFYPREDTGHATFGYMKMQMVVAHGGRCAERIVFGDDITDGGTHDLERITMIAREMVISPANARLGLAGLTRRVGLNRSSSGKLIESRWDNPRVIHANMTPEVAELFTRELTRYIDETEDLAMNALRANRHIIDVIAKELLEKLRITGAEVEALMKGLPLVKFEDFVEPYEMNIEEDVPLRYHPLDVYPAPLHRC